LDNHAVVIADASGVIRFWNAQAVETLGHAEAVALGSTLDLIVPEGFREAHWNGYRRAMASGAAASEGQPGPFPVLRADGEIAPVLGRLTLMRSAQGSAIGAMVAFG